MKLVALLEAAVLIFLFAVYWRGVEDRDHLTYYIAYLLLDDKARTIQKEGFEKWIRENPATDADDLSGQALIAIEGLAARATANPASALSFNALIWSYKQTSQGHPPT